MSKAPFYPGWIVLIKHAHMHSAADRDGASSADVTATSTVTFPHHTLLGLFPETCTKLDSEFAFDRCTLGLQMDGEEEKASLCFSTLAWESLGIPALFTSFHWGWKANQKITNGFIHSTKTGLMRLCEQNHQCTKVRKSKKFPQPREALHTRGFCAPVYTLNWILAKVGSQGGGRPGSPSAEGDLVRGKMVSTFITLPFQL